MIRKKTQRDAVAKALSGVPGISLITELVVNSQLSEEKRLLASTGGEKQFKSLIQHYNRTIKPIESTFSQFPSLGSNLGQSQQ